MPEYTSAVPLLMNEDARDALFHSCTDRLEVVGTNLELMEAVQPILRRWIEREYGVSTYRLTQTDAAAVIIRRWFCLRHYKG